ncbi:MAG: TraB/GumN family protein [Bacteriovoracaceae bacterium]
MKYKLSMVLGFCSLFLSCATSTKLTKPFYWKMDYKGRVYYFLGTLHDNFSQNDLPKKIRKDILDSDVVYVEITNDYKESIPPILANYFTKGFPDLKKSLSPVAFKNYIETANNEKFTDIKTSSKAFEISLEKMHPCLISELSSEYISKYGQGYYEKFFPIFAEKNQSSSRTDVQYVHFHQTKKLFGNNIFDRELEKYALKNNKEVKSLDNTGTLASVLEKLEVNRCLTSMEILFGHFSINTLKNTIDQDNRKTEELKKVYLLGDEEQLTSLIKESQATWDLEINNEILTTRNRQWFDSLNLNTEKKIFVIGGVAHFLGKDNLLSQFKERGAIIQKQYFDL